jgi:2-iminobutanoate/2-iminopropanoate deaminase
VRTFINEGAGLPRWSSPISHAVVVDDICYVSGQISVDLKGHYVPGTAADEATRAFGYLFAALDAAGFSRSDLTFVDIAFTDLSDVVQVNNVYASLFPEGQRPARTVYQAAALPFGGRVKLTGVAIRERRAG